MTQGRESQELWDEIHAAVKGDDDGRFYDLYKQVPLSPEVAMAFKEGFGSDFMRNNNFNLSAAEEAYGPDWLSR